MYISVNLTFTKSRFYVCPGKGEVFGADVDPDKQVMSSKADVKAMTYCELECISVKGLLGVFDLYPEFATTLMKDLK